jgi:hypothetical protein
MGQKITVLAAALLQLLSAWPAGGAAPGAASGGVIEALAPVVEATVVATRPRHWPMKRACLYYALAGQTLLARQGIATRLVVGQVVYQPGTPAAYAIAPHAWLETETRFVDYAALPRWGRVAVIPRDLVAVHPSEVVPGVTRVQVIADALDAPLQHYLNHHQRCFRGRWLAQQK